MSGRESKGPGAGTKEAARDLVTVPNALSLLRLAAVGVFVWLFLAGLTDAAIVVFAGAAVTDFLDGFIARRTGAITEIGKLLDPLADRLLIVALAIVLVVTGALPLWLALAVIARDVLVLGLWPLVERGRAHKLRVNFAGKAATAFLFVGLALVALAETSVGGGDLVRGSGMACAVVGACLYWLAGAMYARAALSRDHRTAEQQGD